MTIANPPIPLPDDPDPRVSIVVLLTRDAARAARCLRALAAGVDCAAETILILNAASADVRALVAESAPQARVLDSEADLGTVIAWNEALRIARAPYVAFLHEDTEPQPRWLAPLVETLDADPRAAIAGCRLLNPDGSLQTDGWVMWADAHVTSVSEELTPAARADGSAVADYVSSACMLVDRAAAQRAGGFDERLFPAIYADAELALALWAQGRTVVSQPRSVVVHAREAMLHPDGLPSRRPTMREFLYARNRLRVLEKWGDPLPGRVALPAGVFADAASPGLVAEALAATRARAQAAGTTPPPARAALEPAAAGPARVQVADAVQQAARAARQVMLEEQIAYLDDAVTTGRDGIDTLTAILGARDEEIAAAKRHIDSLTTILAARDAELASLKEHLGL